MARSQALKQGDGPASQVAETGEGVGVSDPYLTKTTQQAYLERLQNGELAPDSGIGDPEQVNAPYATEDTETADYVGVSPEYMTHAGVAGQPFASEDGVEEVLEEKLTSGFVMQEKADPPEGNQIAGSGSKNQTVYTATSGENFQPELVDPSSVDAHLNADEEPAPEEEPAPGDPVE